MKSFNPFSIQQISRASKLFFLLIYDFLFTQFHPFLLTRRFKVSKIQQPDIIERPLKGVVKRGRENGEKLIE